MNFLTDEFRGYQTSMYSQKIAEGGWDRISLGRSNVDIDSVAEWLFQPGKAGSRALLRAGEVAELAREILRRLIGVGILSEKAVAIQAIAFDKTDGANWKVPWHQDLIHPFAEAVRSPGYLLPSLKDGIHYAQPPVEVLNDMLAARLHFDDCTEENGPLRVSPGSHRLGIIPQAQISEVVARLGEEVCLANKGEILLMKPLTLHASSKALQPLHRRVLHIVFHSGAEIPEKWLEGLPR